MRVTIRDIARRAAVSKTTVSFAFNDPSRISRETRRRIMAIAEELGYVPDPVARTLATRRIPAIGVLLPQPIAEVFRNPYAAELVQGIGEICQREGFSLTLIPPQRGMISAAIRDALVGALIVFGMSPEPRIARLLGQRGLPYVTVDGEPGSPGVNVGIDDEKAAARAMEHVLDLGHRRVEIIALRSVAPSLCESAAGSRTVARRLAGFRRVLKARGIPMGASGVRVHSCEGSMRAAARLAHRVLESPARPTAIVCMSDIAAYGVYAACRALGVAVPGELSVVGFDDLPVSSLLAPPLTTLRQPGYEKGRHAARAALNLIAGRPVKSVTLETELIVRGSTAPPATAS